MGTMLEHALEYAKQGIPVFPLGKRSKRPLFRKEQGGRGVLDATTDPDKITKWWTAYPEANIGGACGAQFVVLDVDPEGEPFVQKGLLGEPNVITPRGKHFYFTVPEESLPGTVGFKPGLDFRSNGNYVVLPPSKINEDGTKGDYVWNSRDLADVPDWVVFALTHKQFNEEKPPRANMDDVILDGARDVEFTSRIGRVVASGMKYDDVLAVAKSLNTTLCKPPMPDAQVIKIVNSVWKRDKAKPTKGEENSAPKTFELKSFRQMLEEYGLREEKYMVEDWLPEATCALVVAQPGMFKTWFVLAMAMSIAKGEAFLGRHKVRNPGPVIIIQQEDSYSMLIDRIAQIEHVSGPKSDGDNFEVGVLADHPNLLWYDKRDFNFGDKEIMAAFENTCRKIRPRMVMIDPLYSAGDSDDYMAKTAHQMLALKRLRDELGTSFVIVHHMGKGEGKSRARDMAWGSQFLNAWLETGWQFVEGDDCDVRIHRHHKNFGKMNALDANVTIDEFSFDVEYVNANEETTASKAIELVKGGHVKSLGHAAELLGMTSKTSVKRLFDKLGITKQGDKFVYEVRSTMEND